MKHLRVLAITTAFATAFGSVAAAQGTEVSTADDGEWISLTGNVISATGEQFTLDYGDNDIIVEVDDFDAYDENLVVAGDKVTVSGTIDADFAENKTLEASSIYIDVLNEYFYASSTDEEGGYYSYAANSHWGSGNWISLSGEVTSIDGRTFTLDTGVSEYVIDTDQMPYNPLDNNGAEQIEVGERVVVSGEFETFDLFGDEDIAAAAVTTLSG